MVHTSQRGRFKFVFVLILLGFAPGCKILNTAEPVQFTSDEWNFKGAKGRKLTSEHYVLYTTCKSADFVNALPGFMETCWREYAKVLPSDKTVAPCESYLFGGRQQWESFTNEFAPSRAETYRKIRSGGYSERGLTVSHYDTQRSTLSVLAHEGLHQYLEVTRGADIPPWLNEGLACYFEAFDLTPDNRPIFKPETNNLRAPGLREALVGKSLIPMKEILGTNAGLELQKRSAQVRNYYSQEWALILFLMQPARKNPYHEGFQQLLAELGSEGFKRRARAMVAADTEGEMSFGEAVFRAYISDDVTSFQAQYEAFLSELLGMKK